MPAAEPWHAAQRAPIPLALITHYFPSHGGGVEAVALEIASRLASSGTADIAWHASATDTPPTDKPRLRFVPAAACNVIERRSGLPFPLWTPRALARLVRAVRASDVVHLHDFLYLPNLMAWAAARVSGRPVVVTQHIGPIRYRNPLLRLALATANRLLGKLVLGSASQVLFVSRSVLEYFSAFVRFRRPPLLVANGVDAELFAFADERRRQEVRAALGVAAGTPLLLFVGRFVEKKGLSLLRQIVPRLPAARWIFAGRGPLDPSGWGLPNVFVKTGMRREELVPLYQAADLLVLPSYGEGFPLVVQEAMACGTPALVSDETAAGSPQAASLLLHEPLAVADAAARWSARLEALLASPETMPAFRRRVAEHARAIWSWERCAQRYDEVLRNAERTRGA